MNEKKLRAKTIKSAIEHYKVKHAKEPYKSGDRIPYAGRVFNEKEISNLTDAALDFWLTAGKYADQFEKDFAGFLGVRYC